MDNFWNSIARRGADFGGGEVIETLIKPVENGHFWALPGRRSRFRGGGGGSGGLIGGGLPPAPGLYIYVFF